MPTRSRSSLRELNLRPFVIIQRERKGHIDRRKFRGLGVRPRHAKSLGDSSWRAPPIALCEQAFPASVVKPFVCVLNRHVFECRTLGVELLNLLDRIAEQANAVRSGPQGDFDGNGHLLGKRHVRFEEWSIAGLFAAYNHLLTPGRQSCKGYLSWNGVGMTANSRHGEGVNLLLGDGAVRFVSEPVQRDVWRAVGTIAGGEPVSQEAF